MPTPMFPERPRNEDEYEDVEIDPEPEIDLDDLVELDELEDLDSDIPAILATPPAEPATGSLAAFDSGVVREADVAALSDLGRTAARTFASAWPALPVETRRRILEVMEELTEERFDLDFGRSVRVAMRDEDAVVRQRALQALWGDDDEALVTPLLDLLRDDPSPDVRAEAARSLAPFALLAEAGDLAEDVTDRVRERLMSIATDDGEDPLVQRIALESAAVFGGEEVSELIRDAYDSGEHDRIGSALFAMGRTHDKMWLPFLLEELASEDAQLRYESARALGTIGSDAAVAELLAAMDGEEDVEVRHAAIAALGEIGSKSAKRALETIAAHAEEADAEAIQAALEEAAFAIGEIGL